MINNYPYPDYELWDESAWEDVKNPLSGLIVKIGEMPEVRDHDNDPEYQKNPDEVRTLPGYHSRTNSYDDPDIVSYWANNKMRHISRTGNKIRHLYLLPEETCRPVLLIYHKENYDDPFWSLKTLSHYGGYCKEAAVHRFGLVFVVTDNEPDRRRTYVSLKKHLKVYSPDLDRIYLDLTLLKDNGICLKDIKFSLSDSDGSADPDSLIEDFFGHPVLNVADSIYEREILTWKSATEYGLHNGKCDFKRLHDSETGRKLIEGVRLEHDSDSPYGRYASEVFTALGLKYLPFNNHSQPWWAFVPQSASDPEKKLPLLAIFCFPLSERLEADVISNAAFYYYFLKLASREQFIVAFLPGFSYEKGEDEFPAGLISSIQEYLPVNSERIYISGHSHQGYIAQKFAREHGNLIAGAAILNDCPGIPLPDVTTEDIPVTDEEIEMAAATDVPMIIVSGCCENKQFFPVNREAVQGMDSSVMLQGYGASAEGRMTAWNRRLRSLRCAEVPFETLLGSAASTDKAERELGFTADRLETVSIDGHEHYIADIRNIDGNYHFRVVAEENIPHLATPSGLTLAWDYIKHFKRDMHTGEIHHEE